MSVAIRVLSLRVAGLAVVVSSILLTGCASESGEATGKSAATPPPASEDRGAESDELGPEVSFEGSVTTADGQFVTYPDGFTVRFVSAVELKDKSLGYEVAADQTLVKVTLDLENEGPEPVLLEDNNTFMDLFYGTSRFDAEITGYAGDKRTLQDPPPTRVAPGTTQVVYRTFKVPVSELGELVVRHNISPDRYTPYDLLDVDKALQR